MVALGKVGWQVLEPVSRSAGRAQLAGATRDADLVLITTPDGAIAEVAAAIQPSPDAVVAHTAGAQTLEPLGGHPKVASLHPLATIPDPIIGVDRLLDNCAFAVDGDALVCEVVAALGGRAFHVRPDRRVAYHAAAVIASNHLVALMGQVERVAAMAGIPLEAYLDLAAQSLANVGRLGPAAALTGPVARGDWGTVARHIEALGPSEVDGYEAMVRLARRLVDGTNPAGPGIAADTN